MATIWEVSCREGKMNKWGQLYGDRRKLDFGVGHAVVYADVCIIHNLCMKYTML